MKLKLRIFLVSLCTCGLATQSPAANDYLAGLVKRIQPAIVTVLTYDSQSRPLSQGSGFFLNEQGHLVTSLNLLEGAYRARIRTSNGAKHSVTRVLAEHTEAGLVKVSVDMLGQSVMPLRMAEIAPEITEPVIVVGAAGEQGQVFSEGIVVVVRNTPLIGPVYQISAPVRPDLVGGPVLNGRAEVVGVARVGRIAEQDLNVAIDAGRFLSSESRGTGKTVREWAGDVSRNPLGPANQPYHEAMAFAWAGKYTE
ncbi:MAG: S1 family peptidase, partial [Planctomycetota bacterium]